MFGGGLPGNIDTLLDIASRVAWVLFIIYTVFFFIRTVYRHGFVRALIFLISYRVLLPLLIVLGINILSLALVFVQPRQVGVVVSLLSPGGVRPQPFRAGLQWILPLVEEVVIYPIYWQTYTMSSTPQEGQVLGDDSIRARTSDGQEVRLSVSAIFRIDIDQAILVHIDWQDRYVEDFVRPTIRGFVRTQVSQFQVAEVNSSARKDLEATLDRLLTEEFSQKGLIMDQFLLRDVTFSPEYVLAIELKQVALEDITANRHKADQVRELARGQADAIEIEARAQSNALKLIAEALAEHPDLVTYRYVEKLAPGIKVMLVPSESPLILPLPSLDETPVLTQTLITTPTTTIDSGGP